MNITRNVEVKVSITPTEAGQMFAAMDSREQAAFFNAAGRAAYAWPQGIVGWCGQALDIVKLLDPDGQYLVERLADHFAGEHNWTPFVDISEVSR